MSGRSSKGVPLLEQRLELFEFSKSFENSRIQADRLPPPPPLDSAALRPRSWQALSASEASPYTPRGRPNRGLSEWCPERAQTSCESRDLNHYNQVVFFVYMVRCADGTLYTGYARDAEERVRVHNIGKGAKYTRSRLPVTLVYTEQCESLSAALKRECELKPWSRARKEALIAGDLTLVKQS